MWMPTHVQVTVQRASILITKGKNDTNDCFVTINLGKTKYQTSVKEKAGVDIEWHEECELAIPDQGNTAEIVLTVLHRNFLGVDEFLGRVVIPLNELDVYERPKNRWYTLQSKSKKDNKTKERGQLEVKTAFIVKSGSLTDLSKKEKHKSSIGQLTHAAQSVGGSLLSITSIEKRKGIKKFAKSIGSKMNLRGKKKDFDENSSIGSVDSLKRINRDFGNHFKSKQTVEDADPGVVSDEDDDFTFDDLSHKSSANSLNQSVNNSGNTKVPSLTENVNKTEEESLRKNSTGAVVPSKPPRAEQKTQQDEWDLKLYGKPPKGMLKPNGNETLNKKNWESPKLSLRIEEEVIEPQPENNKESPSRSPISNKSPQSLSKIDEKVSMLSKLMKIRKGVDKHDSDSKLEKLSAEYQERLIIAGENDAKVTSNDNNNSRVSNDIIRKFEGKSREDLIVLVCDMQNEVEHYRKKMNDLEDYLDELLLRVMETTPVILQNPYVGCKMINS